MPLHHTTPLLPSIPLQQRVNKAVWLKMESSQPSASFKMRGMGLAAERAVAAGATQLVSSSGGNAGYAVACAGRAPPKQNRTARGPRGACMGTRLALYL